MNTVLQAEFSDNPSVLHIELGAKCGDFGKRYHAPCYLTERNAEAVAECSTHFIDRFCSAHSIPWPDNRFEKVIMCNPFEYGFNDNDSTRALLNELGRVLVHGGEILVLASTNNKWGASRKIRTRLEDYQSNNGLSFTVESETIDAEVDYAGFEFRRSSGLPAFPNERTRLYVSK